MPIVGGLAMLLGIVLGGGLLPLQQAPAPAFLAACSVLVTVADPRSGTVLLELAGAIAGRTDERIAEPAQR